MKKGYSKNSQTENTFETTSQDKEPSVIKKTNQQNLGMASLNLNSVESNLTTGLDSAHEKKALKHPKRQEPLRNSDPYQAKLALSIRETFLEIRQKAISESPDCVTILKRVVPFEESNEVIMSSDPLLLLQYVKQIFDKVLELKVDAEKELNQKNENECGDYESMLQKLEAEVRQHIRIEQQLKLYIESVQSKLEEQEKEVDTSKFGDIQKEVENLHQEKLDLSEKMKQYEEEIQNLKKKLSHKVQMIEKLEKQMENLPVLKKMVREMDKVLDGGQSKAANENLMRGSQRSAKDIQNYGHSNTFCVNETRARKGSQPVVGSHSQDRHRDSNDYIRIIDASTHFNDGTKQQKDKKDKVHKEGSRHEGFSMKSTTRLEDKSEDYDDVPKNHRKSVKGESNRKNSREKNVDQDGLADNAKEVKALINAKIKDDIIEPSRFSCDAAFRVGMEEYLKRSFEKTDNNKSKKKNNETSITKKNKTQVIENLKEKTSSSHKNSVVKSRPGTACDKGGHHDLAQSSAEPYGAEMYKSKDSSTKKAGHDRSQSVEPKKKFLKQHKSKGSINEDEVEEYHKKQTSFSGHQKGAGHSKTNQSGSATFTKSSY